MLFKKEKLYTRLKGDGKSEWFMREIVIAATLRWGKMLRPKLKDTEKILQWFAIFNSNELRSIISIVTIEERFMIWTIMIEYAI